jgi:hypothetical protein
LYARFLGKLALPTLPSRTFPVAFIFMCYCWSINACDIKIILFLFSATLWVWVFHASRCITVGLIAVLVSLLRSCCHHHQLLHPIGHTCKEA